MVYIRELEQDDQDYIEIIAKLHIKAFPHFFLTQLGAPFLRTLYKGYLENIESGIIVAESKGKLLGFIAYSKDYPIFYKELLKKHFFKFAFFSFGAALRHPSFVKRLLNAFKKSESVIKEERYVELASICVNPQIKSQGVGTKLINNLIQKTDFEKYAYINLETDADGNDSVNVFYQKSGFKIVRQFITAEGRRMNEYRYFKEGNF
jgi:Acetyltransferases